MTQQRQHLAPYTAAYHTLQEELETARMLRRYASTATAALYMRQHGWSLDTATIMLLNRPARKLRSLVDRRMA